MLIVCVEGTVQRYIRIRACAESLLKFVFYEKKNLTFIPSAEAYGGEQQSPQYILHTVPENEPKTHVAR